MGGGGQGSQSTQNTASYPEEFKPLASRAVNQITALQNALPVAGFAQANPGQTAGISPFQQATMNFAPGLLAPSWGLQTLQNLGQPIGELANNAIGVGNQTSPFSNALTALASGGFGTGQQSFPGAAAPTPFTLQQPNMTQAAPQPNVVGGGSDLISQLMMQLNQPVPSTTPVLPGGITGPVPPPSPPGSMAAKSPPAPAMNWFHTTSGPLQTGYR